MKLELTAIIDECPEGGYCAYCPEVDGAVGEGKTVEEARSKLLQAIELIFEECKIDNTGKAKPVEKWDVTDFLAIGVQVQRSTATTRIKSTATGTPGLKDTGLTFTNEIDFKKFKFAK